MYGGGAGAGMRLSPDSKICQMVLAAQERMDKGGSPGGAPKRCNKQVGWGDMLLKWDCGGFCTSNEW
jgi:hypothetical protein